MPLGRCLTTSDRDQDTPPESRQTIKNASISPVMVPPTIQFQATEPQYSFDRMILNKATYDAIQDVLVLYEKQDLLFGQWGLEVTHKMQRQGGINLYGPSGTGKSMAAHAIAKQLGRKVLSVDYSQIESKYVGETAKNLVAMFNYAKESQAILFFDEADALLSRRVTNMTNSTDVSVNQTRSVLLLLLSEYDDLVLFASNFIANYDPAFLRRILSHVKFELPDEANRVKLWHMYIPQQMPTDVDIPALSAKYSGITGSDISAAVLNAALRAARLQDPLVCHAYFEQAIERIIASKEENNELGTLTSKRTVSERYVKEQFEGELPK